MPLVTKAKTQETVVELSPQEVRAAIEHAAWCAAVDSNPSITVKGSARISPDGSGGYRVTFIELENIGA